MSQFLFYFLSAIILIFGLLAVSSRRILRAAVYLLFVLIATACIYILMNYLFIAAVQVAVYAGGIMVLIIFSILLTSQIDQKLDKPRLTKVIGTALLVLAGSTLCLYGILHHPFSPAVETGIDPTMKNIGNNLMSMGQNGYALPFELISVLLLAALIGAVVIAKKQNK
jgi:NADH-quinone oxidoreductase subunit J